MDPEKVRARRVFAAVGSAVGFGNAEIAAALGIVTGAVRRILLRARDSAGENALRLRVSLDSALRSS